MKKNIQINYDQNGMEKRVVEVVDAQKAGDYEVWVEAVHTKPNTWGRVTVRVVAGAGARVKVGGIIKIAKNVQNVENFLELRALILDKTATVVLDPELEIEANNVRASHAASSGPIDLEQILYLQSKGLTQKEAKKEIVGGFLSDMMI